MICGSLSIGRVWKTLFANPVTFICAYLYNGIIYFVDIVAERRTAKTDGKAKQVTD